VYTSASQIKDLLSIVGPDLGPYKDTIVSLYERNIMFTLSFLEIPSDQFGIYWFQDGSMLIFIFDQQAPELINDMMELRCFLMRFNDRNFVEQFAQRFAIMAKHYIQTVQQPSKSDRELMIIDLCDQYQRVKNANS